MTMWHRGALVLFQVIALLLVMSVVTAGTASAKACGGSGQNACAVWKPGPICNKGLGKINGKKCAPCGKLNQKACPAAEQGATCQKNLKRVSGYCRAPKPKTVSCGGNGQKACNPLKPGPICKPGLGKVNGDKCAPCGKLNQKACPAIERGKTCQAGLDRRDGYCKKPVVDRCGGLNQKACNPLKPGPICNPGLGKFDGTCKPCGKAGQRACPAIEQGSRCSSGLDYHKGYCLECGGNGQRACPVLMSGPVCKPGLGKFDGTCRPCGQPGQNACPAIEQGRQCSEWSTKRGGECVPCGSENGRACRVTDKGPACKPGLAYQFGKCESKSVFRDKYFANKPEFDRRHNDQFRSLSAVGAGDGIPPGGDPGASDGINVEGWVFQAATNEDKRALMVRRLDRADVDVVTLISTGGGAVVLGYTHGYGYAMMKDDANSTDTQAYVCREIKANVFTAGLALGGGLNMELGDWSGDFDTLEGWSNGWQVAAGILAASWGKGAHWSADEGGSDGVTVSGGAGAGLDAGGEYARSHTKVKDEVACDSMAW